MKVYLAGGMRVRPVKIISNGKLLEPKVTEGGLPCDETGTIGYTKEDMHWQDVVKRHFTSQGIYDIQFLDPCDRPGVGFDQFATLDLHHVKQADVVFGYLEKDNPSGVGMAVEMGYAKGLGKTVIFVNETDPEDKSYRYKEFIKKSACITFTDFVEGVLFLEKMQA